MKFIKHRHETRSDTGDFLPEELSLSNIEKVPFYDKLKKKTQMIRNLYDSNEFTNRYSHTANVVNLCSEITKALKCNTAVDENRLKISAYLHDLGHTPFGHAGEDAINDMFLSVDGIHFSENFPGVFKHNINSIRILSLNFEFEENDFVLVDSILKHTSPFPKTYSYTVFTDENIVKSNYILRKTGFSRSSFLKDFGEASNRINCSQCSKDPIPGRMECFGCKKKCFCFCSKSDKGLLSEYFSYRYPATVEGNILLWADEISCLCSDLLDIFKYLLHYEKNISKFIPLSKLISKIKSLISIYPTNDFVVELNNYCNELIDPKIEEEQKWANVKKITSKIERILINCLSLKTPTSEKNMIKLFNEDGCGLLIDMDNDMRKLFSNVKETIYKDIHYINYIDSTNKVGGKIIKKLVSHYLKDFNSFLFSYCKILNSSEDEFLGFLAKSICEILISSSTEEYKNEFVTIVANDKWLRKMESANADSILRIREIFKHTKDGTDENDIQRVLNLVRREICFFVATLNEEQIVRLAGKYDINEINDLPKVFKNSLDSEQIW